MEIGQRIRWLRKEKKMTLDDLGVAVGVTRQTVSRYETGAIDTIPPKAIDKIACALDVTPEYLRGITLESARDSALYDIQELKKQLETEDSEEDRVNIINAIEVLEESYNDLTFALQVSSNRNNNIDGLAEQMANNDAKWSGFFSHDVPFSSDLTPNAFFDGLFGSEKKELSVSLNIGLYWMLKKKSEEDGCTIADEIQNAVQQMILSDIIRELHSEQGEV